MSSVSIQPNSGGTGVFTIETPSTSTNYTLNLPAENGTLLTSGSTVNQGSKIQPIDATTTGGSLTVTLNPTVLDFRSPTTASGTVNTRIISSAISVTVPSGGTLGTVSGQQSFIVVLALDNAGTIELAVVNLGSVSLTETNLISTTAISSGSSSSSVVYSTTARTSLPYRVVGFISSTQTTAGVWVVSAGTTTIQGIGGQAMASLSSLGFGQTWQNVTGSRAVNTTYYNTTGKPIFWHVDINSSNVTPTINGVPFQVVASVNGNTSTSAINLIVPVGGSYSTTGGGITFWIELR